MPIGDLLASITGEPSPTQANASRPLSQPTKRKPSDAETLRRPADKLQRTNSSNSNPAARSNTSRSVGQSARPGAVDTSMSRMRLNTDKRTPISSTSSPITSSTPRNGQPPTPSSAIEPRRAAPKKGSYAEIMARGKMAQATMGQVGAIKHKRIEKLPSKREREDMKAQQAANLSKNIGPGGKFRNTPGAATMNGKPPEGRNGSKLAAGGKGKAAPAVPEKKIKKAALATTGYAGTARPKPGAKLGSKPTFGSSSRERDRDRYGRRPPALGSREDRYDSYDDEEDEMEEDDQPDYESDASSDMEAAAFEVDEEEAMAAKIARKEDQLALEEENRLKREKNEKKKKLMAMAKKAGKKR